jgi:hypothetical protein
MLAYLPTPSKCFVRPCEIRLGMRRAQKSAWSGLKGAQAYCLSDRPQKPLMPDIEIQVIRLTVAVTSYHCWAAQQYRDAAVRQMWTRSAANDGRAVSRDSPESPGMKNASRSSSAGQRLGGTGHAAFDDTRAINVLVATVPAEPWTRNEPVAAPIKLSSGNRQAA